MAESEVPSLDRAEIPQGGSLVSATFVPNEIELFMFCAATWNTHRIHYDRRFAQASGFRELVVPGPLQTARLAQMIDEFAGRYDGHLTTMSVRHHATLYCNEPAHLTAHLTGVRESESEIAIDVSVQVTNAVGLRVTSGHAAMSLTTTDGGRALVRRLRSEVA